MREILFHGKRKDNGEWVYWNMYGRICTIKGKETRVVRKTSSGERYYYHTIEIKQLLDLKTITQYTGSPDKNGRPIFEGDICKVTMFTCEGEDKHYLCEVCFDCGSFVFRERSGFDILPVDIYDFETDVEVIGNITDNQELLEK